MRRFSLLLIFALLALTPASAQNQTGYPLPETLPAITPENASQLHPLADIGGDLPGDLAWSPDGKTLVVGTTDGVRTFDSTNWDLPPRSLPGWKDVRFDAEGNLISDGKVIDPVSGNIISDTLNITPSGKSRIDYRDLNGNAVVVLTDIDSGLETTLDTGLPGTIQYVVFSPDEQFAALKISTPTGTYDGPVPTAQLWNLQTGTLIENLELGESYHDPIYTIGFHMEGNLLVISSRFSGMDGIVIGVHIWHGQTGEKLNQPVASDVSARFSPDDRLILIPNWKGIFLWSDDEIGLLKGEYTNPVFSPDGQMLAAYNAFPSSINIWNIDTALRLGQPDKIFTSTHVHDLIFSPDGKLLASHESGNRVRIWNIESNIVEVVISNIDGEVQFSPDGKWILAKRVDTSLFALWDAYTGELLMDFEEEFAINPDWTLAAQGSVQILSLPDGQAIRSLPVFDNYVGAVQWFDADESRILFREKIFDTHDGNEVSEIDYYPSIPLNPNAFSAGWRRILVTAYPKITVDIEQPTAQVLQLAVGQRINATYFLGDRLLVPTTAFLTQDGATIGYITRPITGGAFRTSRLELREVETRKLIQEWTLPGDIQAMSISHDGKWLVLGSSQDFDGYLMFLNLEGEMTTKSPIIRAINNPSLGSGVRIMSITFSADDQHLALVGRRGWCGDGGCIYYYFTKNWSTTLLMSDERLGEQFSMTINDVHAPVFSPDGNLVLVTTVDGWNSDLYPGAIQLWTEVGHKKLVDLSGDDGIATFSPDGRLLVLHEADQTVLYDTAALKRGESEPVATIDDQDKPVKQLAFKPDGTILYIVSDNRLWLYGVDS